MGMLKKQEDSIKFLLTISGKKKVKEYAKFKRMSITELILTLLEKEMNLTESLSTKFN